MGEDDKAFAWFTPAVRKRSGWVAYMRVDPRLDALQTDPRFRHFDVEITTVSPRMASWEADATLVPGVSPDLYVTCALDVSGAR
jgi:hypothetical protein